VAKAKREAHQAFMIAEEKCECTEQKQDKMVPIESLFNMGMGGPFNIPGGSSVHAMANKTNGAIPFRVAGPIVETFDLR
jgi:hypothetical protein